LKIVFWGTPELAVPTLEAVAGRHEVVAVVCQPDRPKGRSGKPAPPPVKEWALAHGIPVEQPTKLNDGVLANWLLDLGPDVCVLAAYGRLINDTLLNTPRHGFLNMHPSLLPLYRGPSPIQSALLNGDTETGVSIMRLVKEMDAGNVLLQERVAIGKDENNVELSARLADLGARLMLEALAQVEAGTAVYTPQDHARATHCRMISKDDGQISWAESAPKIHNMVRAMQPWPGAQCLYQGESCRIWRSEWMVETSDVEPGTVTQVLKDRVLVACGEGQLAILEFQAPGKKAMPMGAYLLGHAMQAGERL